MDIITRETLTAFIGWLFIWLALWTASVLIANPRYDAGIDAISTAAVVDERDV